MCAHVQLGSPSLLAHAAECSALTPVWFLSVPDDRSLQCQSTYGIWYSQFDRQTKVFMRALSDTTNTYYYFNHICVACVIIFCYFSQDQLLRGMFFHWVLVQFSFFSVRAVYLFLHFLTYFCGNYEDGTKSKQLSNISVYFSKDFLFDQPVWNAFF